MLLELEKAQNNVSWLNSERARAIFFCHRMWSPSVRGLGGTLLIKMVARPTPLAGARYERRNIA